jgi:hypothetical protein
MDEMMYYSSNGYSLNEGVIIARREGEAGCALFRDRGRCPYIDYDHCGYPDR